MTRDPDFNFYAVAARFARLFGLVVAGFPNRRADYGLDDERRVEWDAVTENDK